ncbi:HelD family protein [Paenibacillus chungangensis]|uniref:HelD family protein n=1 Tax=Paenibacillus chungangensis TaxID=696535 RepID=A0ABW3HQ61_9BACL
MDSKVASTSVQQDEELHLKSALESINNQLQEIGPRYTGDDFTEQMLDLQREERKRRLEIARREPYFGRMDFRECGIGSAGEHPVVPLYIGKAGVARDKAGGDPLVIDWRAPVASMFYSFTGGTEPASYVSPDGEISGDMHLKRNFVIRQGELIRYVDSYVRGQEEGESVRDEFLLYRLGENKDNKLRDIVSTIQSEQDRIIRGDKNGALFIQGVAGSGKTTVALHRLAFLLYQYAERIKAERMIIFAPSRMFLDYISGVLPELGVGDIGQTTYHEWAIQLLEHDVKLTDPSESLAYWFEQKRGAEDWLQATGRWKGSLTFKGKLDEAIGKLEQYVVPETPFFPVDGMELPPSQIQQWYENDYGDEPLMVKRDRLEGRIRRWFQSELKYRRVQDKKVLAKAKTRLNAYLKKLPSYSAKQLYLSLFRGKEALKGVPQAVAKETAARLRDGYAAAEDMAALVYIHLRLYGLKTPPLDHIVIDEAQDYSPLQLETLRMCQRTTSMTILGDLQQGIHGHSGIHSWKELTGLFPDDAASFFELNQSYRSTMEIIGFANYILGEMEGEVKPAVPVFRSGDPVELKPVSEAEWLGELAATASRWQERRDYDTIAVIGRTAAECDAIHRYFVQAGLSASLVESKQPSYGGGLTVVPVYLSKGLEFDAVLIADAGDGAYSQQNAKLLYVGCTRALHKLKLLYRGELSPLLREADRDEAALQE